MLDSTLVNSDSRRCSHTITLVIEDSIHLYSLQVQVYRCVLIQMNGVKNFYTTPEVIDPIIMSNVDTSREGIQPLARGMTLSKVNVGTSRQGMHSCEQVSLGDALNASYEAD